MAKDEIHKNDVGTILRVTIKDGDTVVDVSGATVKTIKLQKPNGVVMAKEAAFYTNGTDGKITYTTVEGDLNAAGKWNIQGYATIGTWTGHSDVDSFEVLDNLS